MSPIKRKDSSFYHIDLRWKGFPRIRVSSETSSKTTALELERMLRTLRAQGRRDLLGLVAAGRITLGELYEAHLKSPEKLAQLATRQPSRHLGDLVDEWLKHLPVAISPKTKTTYAPATIERYRVSWQGFFAKLPNGRESTLADLTDGFVEDYRTTREKAVGGRRRSAAKQSKVSPATMNRDLAALGSFITWLEERKRIPFDRPRMTRQSEPPGRERWLDATELRAFETHCSAKWWPFFATLFLTGMRLGEARGLRREDVRLGQRNRIQVISTDRGEDGGRRLKSRASNRTLPVPAKLAELLKRHLDGHTGSPGSLLFPDKDFQNYDPMRAAWDLTCKLAGIHGATPHDARHTFGVHAALAGVPIPRLQKLLGHASLLMTLRYMRHAPTEFMDDDAAMIESSMQAPDEPVSLKLA